MPAESGRRRLQELSTAEQAAAKLRISEINWQEQQLKERELGQISEKLIKLESGLLEKRRIRII